MDEKIDRIYKNNWVYKIACFFIGHKMSYKEMYLILENLNIKNLGQEESKKRSFEEILKIYQFLNNKLPE